uniref:Uncharacterized protein n=1 Tax=Trifolium pratense TaxID=57577 RepID=Q2PEZ9_TRIPR|nr:hypothetical protein [Trifolium pratense]BAE71203.1 hypothetical protein [Trifolium pratense]
MKSSETSPKHRSEAVLKIFLLFFFRSNLLFLLSILYIFCFRLVSVIREW